MFNKVIGKQCNNPGCDLRGTMKDASAYLCESCSLELTPIVKTNSAAVIGLALGGLLLIGGLGWAVRSFVVGRVAGAISGSDGPARTTTGASAFQFAVQSEGDGRPQNVGLDHVFRSGDRLRLLLRGGGAAHYYVFYEDRANDKMEILHPEGMSRAVAANEAVAVPPGNGNWLKLDQNPGQERFVIIAAASAVDELDFGASNCSRPRFESALEQVKGKYGLAEVKTVNDLDWTRVESKGKGLMLTRFAVQHQ